MSNPKQPHCKICGQFFRDIWAFKGYCRYHQPEALAEQYQRQRKEYFRINPYGGKDWLDPPEETAA